MAQGDHYGTLGIVRSASQEEVRAGYRRMAMKWHPNRHATAADKAQAEEKFKEVQRAYDTLGDPAKRAAYDSPTDPLASMFRHQADEYQKWARERDEQMRRYRENLPRGPDATWIARVSLAEAIHGGEVQYARKKRAVCDDCNGYGFIDSQCSTCNGIGQARAKGRICVCPTCYGDGLERNTCPVCEGTAKVSVTETSRIRVPKGVVDGSEILAKGLGKTDRYGGLPGDLHITIRIKPERGYKFTGCEIAGALKVPFSVAMLGGDINVDLPHGRELTVRVPARTNSGKKIRLAGAGLTARNASTGDALLTVAIVLPKSKRKLTPTEEQLIRSLDE